MDIINLRALLDEISSKSSVSCFQKWQQCYHCCTTIFMTKWEETRAKKCLKDQWYSEPPNWKWKSFCEYLNENWQCCIYDERPIVCRMYWLFDEPFMKCPLNNHVTQKMIPELAQYLVSCRNSTVQNANADITMKEWTKTKLFFDIKSSAELHIKWQISLKTFRFMVDKLCKDYLIKNNLAVTQDNLEKLFDEAIKSNE